MTSIVYDPIGEYARNTIQVRAPAPNDREGKVIPFTKDAEEAAEDAA